MPLLVRGVYSDVPYVSPEGYPVILSIAQRRPGEDKPRLVEWHVLRPGEDRQSVTDTLWRNLDVRDPVHLVREDTA